MNEINISDYLNCILSIKECNSVITQWMSLGPSAVLVVLAAIAILGMCIKMWDEKISEFLKKNPIALTLVSIVLLLFILFKQILPLIVGLIALVAFLLVKDKLSKIPENRLPGKITPNMLFVSIASIIYISTALISLAVDEYYYQQIAANADQIHVTFLSPSEDRTSPTKRLAQEQSNLLSEALFKEFLRVLNEIFIDVNNVEITPNFNIIEDYQRFSDRYLKFNKSLANRLITDRLQQQKSPIDVIISDYFVMDNLGTPSEATMLVVVDLKVLDVLNGTIKRLQSSLRIEVNHDELSRVALLAVVQLIQYLHTRDLILLSKDQKAKVLNNIIGLFGELYQARDVYKDKRDFNSDVIEWLTAAKPCQDDTCLNEIIHAYGDSIKQGSNIGEKKFATATTMFSGK